jgi:hypothetical protein
MRDDDLPAPSPVDTESVTGRELLILTASGRNA